MLSPERKRRVVEALDDTARTIEKFQKQNWFGFKEKEVERDNMLQFLYCHQATLASMLTEA